MMVRLHKKTKSRKNMNNRGNTMMETIVAFSVLMIIFAMIYQMVSYSSSLRMKAADTAKMVQTLNTEIYRKDFTNGKVLKYTYSTDKANLKEKGPLLYIELSPKTAQSNKARPAGQPRLKLSNVRMDCFIYDPTDEMVTNENLTVPKVAMFIYDK